MMQFNDLPNHGVHRIGKKVILPPGDARRWVSNPEMRKRTIHNGRQQQCVSLSLLPQYSLLL